MERQYRVHVGKLPFAYRTEPEGQYLYILDGALTTYTAEEGGGAAGPAGPPLPPCITATGQGGTQVRRARAHGVRHTPRHPRGPPLPVVLRSSARHGLGQAHAPAALFCEA